MARVTIHGAGVAPVVLAPGESLGFGRAPQDVTTLAPGRTLLALPDCAPHVSRLAGELYVDAERVVLVSSGYHALRLEHTADELGLDAVVARTDGSATFRELARETAAVSVGRIIGFRRLSNLA